MADIVSRPYNPSPVHCCEACCFLRGLHADWCPNRRRAAADEHELARFADDGGPADLVEAAGKLATP